MNHTSFFYFAGVRLQFECKQNYGAHSISPTNTAVPLLKWSQLTLFTSFRIANYHFIDFVFTRLHRHLHRQCPDSRFSDLISNQFKLNLISHQSKKKVPVQIRRLIGSFENEVTTVKWFAFRCCFRCFLE